jgi:hypothetical protein
MGCRVKPGNDGRYLGRFVVSIRNSLIACARRRPSRITHTASAAAHIAGREHVRPRDLMIGGVGPRIAAPV